MSEETLSKLNTALRKNAELQAFIGIDSTKEEIDFIHRKQYQNILFLKEEDPERFERISSDFKKYRVFKEDPNWKSKRKKSTTAE